MRGVGLVSAIAFGVACAGTRGIEADRPYQLGLASVDRIEVRVLAHRPPSVHVNVYGQLPDTCTKIEGSQQQRFGSGIDVTLTTRRESRADCVEERRPFDRRILLDVSGLGAGLYSVSVNGEQGSFQILENLDVRDPPVRLRY